LKDFFMQSIGDLASFLYSSRFQTELKKLATGAATTATTGQVKDKARHLGGSVLPLSLLERKVSLLQQHKLGITEASIFAGVTQSALGKISTQVETLSNSLSLTSQIDSTASLRTFSEKARTVLIDTVRSLNTEVGGRYVFAGAATASTPLADEELMLANLSAIAVGATSAIDLINGIEDWFDLPGGGFETTAYKGSSTGFVTIPLGADKSMTFGLRADDPVVRDSLKALALAAFASDASLSLPLTDQKQAFYHARDSLVFANRSLIEEQSSIGLNEALIDRANEETDTDLARLNSDRLQLVGVDQFEEASRFEAAQQQLEILYRIAARRNETSLAEFLR
jgi:flagellar hook-associated protein 3 FlgL